MGSIVDFRGEARAAISTELNRLQGIQKKTPNTGLGGNKYVNIILVIIYIVAIVGGVMLSVTPFRINALPVDISRYFTIGTGIAVALFALLLIIKILINFRYVNRVFDNRAETNKRINDITKVLNSRIENAYGVLDGNVVKGSIRVGHETDPNQSVPTKTSERFINTIIQIAYFPLAYTAGTVIAYLAKYYVSEFVSNIIGYKSIVDTLSSICVVIACVLGPIIGYLYVKLIIMEDWCAGLVPVAVLSSVIASLALYLAAGFIGLVIAIICGILWLAWLLIVALFKIVIVVIVGGAILAAILGSGS